MLNLQQGKHIWQIPFFGDYFIEDNDTSDSEEESDEDEDEDED